MSGRAADDVYGALQDDRASPLIATPNNSLVRIAQNASSLEIDWPRSLNHFPMLIFPTAYSGCMVERTAARRKARLQMAHEGPLPAYVSSQILPVGTGLLAIGIFVVDTFVLQPNAVAALYVVVVLLSTNFLSWRGVLLVSLGSAALAILGYVLQHGPFDLGDPLVRLLVSLLAIGTTAFLALKSQAGLPCCVGRRDFWTSRTTRSSSVIWKTS
jgi:hypothetical protein